MLVAVISPCPTSNKSSMEESPLDVNKAYAFVLCEGLKLFAHPQS
ncbi:hypothetical protein [uncultured Gammaproteobacteria bacterium]|nr:hypothetical protein [uncultured Gammaproteobacteria bacterium]